MESIFTAIDESRVWGDNHRGSSGGGSDMEYNRERYVPFLKGFIQEHGIRTVDLEIRYTGYDTYRSVVEHHQEQGRLAGADLCILKDVLKHWSQEHIRTFLDDL
jgi:hypothetical protein